MSAEDNICTLYCTTAAEAISCSFDTDLCSWFAPDGGVEVGQVGLVSASNLNQGSYLYVTGMNSSVNVSFHSTILYPQPEYPFEYCISFWWIMVILVIFYLLSYYKFIQQIWKWSITKYFSSIVYYQMLYHINY